eukprot:832362-Prymnesium_polylepis.1
MIRMSRTVCSLRAGRRRFACVEHICYRARASETIARGLVRPQHSYILSAHGLREISLLLVFDVVQP